jgi:hypothetical protein
MISFRAAQQRLFLFGGGRPRRGDAPTPGGRSGTTLTLPGVTSPADAVLRLVDVGGALAATPAPPPAVVALTALLAAAAVGYLPTWRVLRHVVTIAHEGGHAGVAAMTGRRLQGVRLHSDTSGLTVSAGRPTGPGVVVTLLAGYLAPAALGLAAAVALSFGRSVPVLWVAVALLAALLIMIRNLFGMVSVLVTGAVLIGVVGWAPIGWRSPAAYLLTWFLLVSAPRPVLELQRSRRRGIAPASDADQLARLTRLPGVFWVGVFLILTCAALAFGGWLLIRPLLP